MGKVKNEPDGANRQCMGGELIDESDVEGHGRATRSAAPEGVGRGTHSAEGFGRATRETDDDDVEGHNFLPLDTGTARQLARARNADIERSLRERRLAKEARPNKRHE